MPARALLSALLTVVGIDAASADASAHRATVRGTYVIADRAQIGDRRQAPEAS